MIKLQPTPPTPPDLDTSGADTPNSPAQYDGSTNSYLPYSLRNRKFSPYSTNTMKNQKKKENKIDEKVTVDTVPAADATSADTPNASSQDDFSTVSNSKYSLRNYKFPPTSPPRQKTEKKEDVIDDKDNYDTPPLTPTHPTLIPPMPPPKVMAPQTPISHIHWEIAINIAKLPPTPKNMTPNTDANNADALNAADDDDAYTKSTQLYLHNINCSPKINPNKKIKHNK